MKLDVYEHLLRLNAGFDQAIQSLAALRMNELKLFGMAPYTVGWRSAINRVAENRQFMFSGVNADLVSAPRDGDRFNDAQAIFGSDWPEPRFGKIERLFSLSPIGGEGWGEGVRCLRLLNPLNFLERAFPRQDHQVAPQASRELHSTRARDRHLRRSVNRKIGRELANEPGDADVLHNGCVHTRRDHDAQMLLRLGHFVLEDNYVERDVALHASLVQKFHRLRQIRVGKVVGAHSRIEFLQPEINRVRAILYGGADTVPIAGGGQQFRDTGSGVILGNRFGVVTGLGLHFGNTGKRLK